MLLWLPNTDPRIIGGDKNGFHLGSEHLFNAFQYEKCWHTKLAIYRFARGMDAEFCASHKWLSTPSYIHHMAVEIESMFPHDELGTPREFMDTVLRSRVVKAQGFNEYCDCYLQKEVKVFMYERDNFLINMNNVNRQGRDTGKELNPKRRYVKMPVPNTVE